MSLCLSVFLTASVLVGCSQSSDHPISEQSGTKTVIQDKVEGIFSENVYDTQSKFVFDVDNIKYYNTGETLFSIKNENDIDYVFYGDNDNNNSDSIYLPDTFSSSGKNSTFSNIVLINDTYYYCDIRNKYSICSINVRENSFSSAKELYDKKSFVQMIKNEPYMSAITDEQIDKWAKYFTEYITNCVYGGDGFIYFIFLDRSLMKETEPINFRVGRFAIDGSKIEMMSYICASDMTVKNGHIYYYNDGREYFKGKAEKDYNKNGVIQSIYSDENGESGQLFDIDFTPDSDSDKMTELCNHMTIVGDYLFYIDDSEKGKSRLYKVNLDGSGVEKLTDDKCSDYYIDTRSSNIYFWNKDGKSNYSFFKRSLNNEKEEILFNLVHEDDQLDFMYKIDVDGDYLYLGESNYFHSYYVMDKNNPKQSKFNVAGQRFNLKDNYLENLDCCVKAIIERDEVFGYESLVYADKIKPKWIKANKKTDENGIITYQCSGQ